MRNMLRKPMEKRSAEPTPWPNGLGHDHGEREPIKPRPEAPRSTWVARLFRGVDVAPRRLAREWRPER